jgi:hypothetical protein
MGGTADGVEVALRCGVEIDHHSVGLPEAVGAREPHVRRDRVLPDEIDERGGVAHEHVCDGPVRLRHLDPPDPLREVVRDVLVEEALAPDPVGEALHAHRAEADMRQHPLADALVVVGEVGLCDPVVRKEQLVRMRDLDRAHDGTSRTTSLAALSSRSPM